MNSEFSPLHESDTNEANESAEEVAAVNTSEPLPDIWLDETESATKAETNEANESAETIDEDAAEMAKPQPTKTEFTTEMASDEKSEPELFADRWLDESETAVSSERDRDEVVSDEIRELKAQKQALQREIEDLAVQKEQIVLQQVKEVQKTIGQMVEEGMKELKERKNALQIEIEKLERRQERIRQEMRTSFAGTSQELAIRVQGFKDYLVGSLQDLSVAAEQLQLNSAPEAKPVREKPPREARSRSREPRQRRTPPSAPQPQFAEQAFAEQTKQIRQLLERYRTRPDYYGSPWQLRRTFEPVHAEKVQEWFFARGGRGAIQGMNSRLQNILIASAVISIIRHLYGDRCQVLVLIDTPEKLGEWRRGLQDCLGISRSDFGANRGVVLFDSAEVVVQRADRLIKDKLLPLIIIDETEELVNLSLLKFPLWLAFAGDNKPSATASYFY